VDFKNYVNSSINLEDFLLYRTGSDLVTRDIGEVFIVSSELIIKSSLSRSTRKERVGNLSDRHTWSKCMTSAGSASGSYSLTIDTASERDIELFFIFSKN
jgi:hypothetical protein